MVLAISLCLSLAAYWASAHQAGGGEALNSGSESRSGSHRSEQTVRVVCLGDTHSRHEEIKVPDGEVLLYSGDFSQQGNLAHVRSFNEWLGKLPHKHKLVIAGNHDAGRIPSNQSVMTDQMQQVGALLTNAKFLMDETVDLKVDVILSHSPPYSIVDNDPVHNVNGSTALLSAISERHPLLSCFGHIHADGGASATLTHQQVAERAQELSKKSESNTVKGELSKRPSPFHDQKVTLVRSDAVTRRTVVGSTLFVNAAVATDELSDQGTYKMREGARPIVVDLVLPDNSARPVLRL